MSDRVHKILLVEPDPDVVELVVAALVHRFNAHLTCVVDAESCLDVEMVNPHDLVVADMRLPDCDGTRLAEQLLTLGRRPIILTARKPTYEEAVQALRLGVKDIVAKPFPVASLLEAAERALRGQEIRSAHLHKHRRLRDLVRRVIQERRDLQRRMELICRDLVGAHRRLVHRVLTLEETRTSGGG